MLGVCYYPEHWPESFWAEDARRMRELGIGYVRIGEFAWSRIEPRRGEFHWGWLDRAFDVLGGAGLRIVLGTPTATPPKWLMDEHPDIAPIDENGRPRGFGSRRHYTFSSQTYIRESARIVEALAKRYGGHAALAGWQTDNEYGCHGTVLSWGPHDAAAFRDWLRARWPDATLWVEVPITKVLANGQRIAGRIDLLLRTTDGWVLFDHKSTSQSPQQAAALASEYGGQLQAYRDAVESVTHLPVRETWLVLPVTGACIRVQRDGP